MKISCLIALFIFGISAGSCKDETKKEEPIQEKPTVYIIGDSTVKNDTGKGVGGLWGWGDYFAHFVDTTKVKVKNEALGGTSSRTFQTKGLWKPVKDSLKKGDYLLIQFGHNDDGPLNDDYRARGTIYGIGEETEEIDNILTGEHEIVHTYGWYLREEVMAAKEVGAIPILISPIPRNDWNDGKISRNNDKYGLWTKQIAAEQNVTFINLNESMASFLELKGEENVTGTYFFDTDHTHTTKEGATLAASLIAKELKSTSNSLKNYVVKPKL